VSVSPWGQYQLRKEMVRDSIHVDLLTHPLTWLVRIQAPDPCLRYSPAGSLWKWWAIEL